MESKYYCYYNVRVLNNTYLSHSDIIIQIKFSNRNILYI